MQKIIYRKAEEKDVDAIAELWIEYFDHHFSVDPAYKRKPDSEKDFTEFLVRAITDDSFCLYVAKHEEGTVGYICCEIDKKPPCFEIRSYGLVSDLAVTEKYRKQGVAKELLKHGVEWFKTKDVQHVEARVLLSNPQAAKFWQSSGFEPFVNILRLKLK